MREEQEKLNDAYRRFQKLQERNRSLMMATIGPDSLPRASYAPYVRDEGGCFYVFVSQLSQHTSDLTDHPVSSVLLMEDEAETKQMFARLRVSYQCDVRPVDPEDPTYGEIMDRFEERFGDVIGLLRSLPDFMLFTLSPRSGRFVTGFGQAYDLGGERLDQLIHVGPAQTTPDPDGKER